jgi:thiol-disulfide isomerase/thioredoxin
MMICAVLVVARHPVAAQSTARLAAPWPSSDLATGTVVVEVVEGAFAVPHANAAVTLVVNGVRRTAKTDERGRAQFDNLTVGATVQASISPTRLVSSERFVVPDSGGVRIFLSTQPYQLAARPESGRVTPVDDFPASIEVRVSYDNLDDTKPPAGVLVSLVGYADDRSVQLVQHRTSARGTAWFTDLDTTGAVVYYALAQLPRKPGADRLVSAPITLNDKGASVVLSGELRTATSAPIDELSARKGLTAVKTPKGKLRVHLAGEPDPKTPIEVLDAATGKVVARGVVPDKELVVSPPVRAGQVLYVEAVADDGRFRSLPFEMVADRGAEVTVFMIPRAGSPRLLASYDLFAFADDAALVVDASLKLTNTSWIPYRVPGGVVLPFPRGATAIQLDSDLATLSGYHVAMSRPLAPGETWIGAKLELPATAGTVPFALDFPYGAFESSLWIEDEPGLSIDQLSPGLAVTRQTVARGPRLVVEHIAAAPNESVAMKIRLPNPGPNNAVQHACRHLSPDDAKLIGTPLDFTLAQLDGRKLELSALRGKPVLVNLTASWDGFSKNEVPKLAAIARQIPVVLVSSDRDPSDVTTAFGKQPFPVVLDPPGKPDENLGVVTRSLGIQAVPESLLLDRNGIIRYHFVNVRDWDSPAALRCVKTFAASP